MNLRVGDREYRRPTEKENDYLPYRSGNREEEEAIFSICAELRGWVERRIADSIWVKLGLISSFFVMFDQVGTGVCWRDLELTKLDLAVIIVDADEFNDDEVEMFGLEKFFIFKCFLGNWRSSKIIRTIFIFIWNWLNLKLFLLFCIIIVVDLYRFR